MVDIVDAAVYHRPVPLSGDESVPHGRIESVDGLRGFAAFLVMSYHIQAGDKVLLGSGQTAMEIFFVLSGFVITRSLLAEGDGLLLRRFYVRRAFRLIPTLVVFICVSLISVRVWQGAIPTNLWWMAGGALAYVSNFVLVRLHGGVGVFGGLWSLSIEEQFYLVWPLLFLGMRRYFARAVYLVLVVLAAASLARRFANLAPSASENWAAYGSDSRALGLLLGCLGAVAVARQAPMIRTLSTRLLTFMGLGACACLIASATLVQSYVPRTFVTWWLMAPVASLVLIVVLSHPLPTPVRRMFAGRLLVALGKISYSLYLWHVYVVEVVEPRFLGHQTYGRPVRYVVMATIAVSLATVSYFAIERPFMRIGRSISRRWSLSDKSARAIESLMRAP